MFAGGVGVGVAAAGVVGAGAIDVEIMLTLPPGLTVETTGAAGVGAGAGAAVIIVVVVGNVLPAGNDPNPATIFGDRTAGAIRLAIMATRAASSAVSANAPAHKNMEKAGSNAASEIFISPSLLIYPPNFIRKNNRGQE